MFQPMEVKSTVTTSAQPSTTASAKPSNAMQLGATRGGMQTVSTGGTGISFARKQDNAGVKSLGAKKLDIDFGTDDFFNSF